MPATTARRLRSVAIVTATLGAVLLPAPLAAVQSVLLPGLRLPASAPQARLAAISHAWTPWVAQRGYLPWKAWPILITHHRLLLGWLILTLAVFAWFAAQVFRGQKAGGTGFGGPPMAGKGEHGTARWRRSEELWTSFALWAAGSPKNPSGIYVGHGPKPDTAWVLASDQHALILGSPGSRKTRGVILPAIGVIGSAKRESMVLSDPKGEIYAHSADWLRAQGYDVVRFDLREASRSARWNPVQAVTDALARGRRDEASALARDVAHLLTGSLESHNHTGEPFWGLAARAACASLILAIAAGKPPSGGASSQQGERWEWPTPEERHMASVYAALISGSLVHDLIEQFPPDHPAYKAWGPVRLALGAQQTIASILSTAATAIEMFGDEEVAWLTAAQDHDLADVGRRPTAVYLVIPDERSTRYPLATLYIQQTLQALASLADESGGKLPTTVNFLLDEFGNLPRIADFDKTVTVARGRGIRLALVVQDLAQLRRHYGDAANTIKGSLSTWIYLRTAEIDTAREIAAKLGSYTVAAENLSVPRVTWWTTTATVGTASTTHSLQARDLLTPEEVLRWPLGQALVLQAGQLPAQLPLPDLSAWAKVWPHIQIRHPEPPARPIEAPPTWRPPQPSRGEGAPGERGRTIVDLADVEELLARQPTRTEVEAAEAQDGPGGPGRPF